VGVEGGITSDYLKANDPGNNLERGKLLLSGTGGAKVRAYLTRRVFVEAAFLFKENAFGFTFKQVEYKGNGSSNGSNIFFIPVRLGYEWKLSDKIYLNATGAVVPTFITLYSQTSSGGTINPGAISFSSKARTEYKKTNPTLQTGPCLSNIIFSFYFFTLDFHPFRPDNNKVHFHWQ